MPGLDPAGRVPVTGARPAPARAGEDRALGAAAEEEASALGHAPVAADAVAAYGPHPDQVVDVYAPRAGERPAPLVVLLHGGSWRAPYDRAHISPLAALLADHGFAVASVEYRRGPGGPSTPDTAAQVSPAGDAEPPVAGRWPETLDDVAAAVEAVPALAAAALGPGAVDPERTVLAGHSAGGHLALWAAARHVQPPGSRWHRASPPPVRGVVALAPLADFTTARELRACTDAVVQFLGGQERFTARRPYADPAALLPTGIPTTIVQGATDIDVPPRIAHAFAEAADAAGQHVRLVLLEGVGHFPPVDPSAPAVRTTVEEITRLARGAVT